MTRQKHTPDGANISIIGETANINFFLNTALTPDSVDDVVNKTSSKKAHTRRRYKGDPAPSNVSAHSYEFMVDPGRIDLQTLPGDAFVLVANGEKRQFTYVGDVMDLHAFLVGQAKYETKLYTQGPPYVIAAAASEGLVAKTR